jgi:membrane protease YdiL (CAAX protease family)
MTDPAPGQAVIEYGDTRSHSRASIGVVLSWLIILGVLAFVFVSNWRQAHRPAVEQAADDITMQMAARVAVGYRAISSGATGASSEVRGPLADNARTMARQVTAEAHTPRERLRAVAVIGEMQGGPAALDELNRVEPFLSSPALRADAASLRRIYSQGPDTLSQEARQNLLRREGWFGELALTFKLPHGDAPRKEVVSMGVRALIATLSMEAGILGLVLAGIALLTIAVVRLIDRKLPLAYRPDASGARPFLEAFALYLAGYVGLGWLLRYLHSERQLVNYGIELLWVGFASVWPLVRGVDWPRLREGLGWHTGRGVLREAGAGLVGYLTGMPVMALAIYTTIVLTKISGERPVHPIVFGTGGSRVAAIVGLYLLASVWAPLVEETMFRGSLFHYLRGRHSWLLAAIVSGLIFAALHPQGWSAIPVLAAIGVIFAAIRQWRGSFVASAAAHALNNAVAVTMLLLVLG